MATSISRERLRSILSSIPWRTSVPTVVLYVSFLLLRIELGRELGGFGEAVASGFFRGAYFDLVVVVYASLVAQVLWTLGAPKRITWPVVAFLLWLAGFSNVIHYKFFGMRLDWWIVRLHWSDFFVVQGSAAQLSWSLYLVVSLLLLLGATVLAAVPRLIGARRPDVPGGPWWRSRLVRLGWVAALFLLCFVLWRVPRWTGILKGSGIIADNVVRVWVKQTTSSYTFAGAGKNWYSTWSEGLDADDPDRPNRVLAAFRAFEDGPERSGPVPVPSERGAWPMVHQLEVDPAQTRALREELGLPLEGPINVILLFLESVRAYEIYHPETGPLLFPRLRQILDQHAIQFTQAYTSSFTAGQTVRGQFSTSCSMLPNMTGAATYIAHGGLRVRCLPQLLKEHGYQTVWMNTHHSTYHNKRGFELAHGTDQFFEGKDFEARGVTETAGRWGLADEPFLVDVVSLVEELAAAGRPVFANVLTISVHHPYSFIDGGPVPDELMAQTEGHTYYRKYLSRLSYEDRALSSFFEALFASPLADNTLVAMVADHSSPVKPQHEISNRQYEEIRFRVPFALVTARPESPRSIATPVHQADMAPLIATVLGVGGEVTWVGRNPFSGQGSPWVYQDSGSPLMFRTSQKGCYPESRKGRLRCYDTTGADPMFAAELPEVPVDKDLVAFFATVVQANTHAIILNRVQPPRLDASRD